MNNPFTGPLYVGAPIRSADCIGLCVAWNDGGETGEETVAEVLPAPGDIAQRQAAFLVFAVNQSAKVAALVKAAEDLEVAAKAFGNPAKSAPLRVALEGVHTALFELQA